MGINVDTTFLLALLQIIWINILLSGDNAVVIALACRSLPPRERKIGVILGAGAAVVLRIIFTLMVVWLMEIPYLKLVGGLLLLWIAVKLLTDEADEASVKESDTIWNAVRTVAIADMVMSLDNVIAIAAAAKGSIPLIVFGLCLSVPLIVFGATLIITLLQRYPALVWAGAGLLGWVAGSIMVSDPGWHSAFGEWPHLVDEVVGGIVGVVFVLGLAWLLRQRAAAASAAEAADGNEGRLASARVNQNRGPEGVGVDGRAERNRHHGLDHTKAASARGADKELQAAELAARLRRAERSATLGAGNLARLAL